MSPPHLAITCPGGPISQTFKEGRTLYRLMPSAATVPCMLVKTCRHPLDLIRPVSPLISVLPVPRGAVRMAQRCGMATIPKLCHWRGAAAALSPSHTYLLHNPSWNCGESAGAVRESQVFCRFQPYFSYPSRHDFSMPYKCPSIASTRRDFSYIDQATLRAHAHESLWSTSPSFRQLRDATLFDCT